MTLYHNHHHYHDLSPLLLDPVQIALALHLTESAAPFSSPISCAPIASLQHYCDSQQNHRGALLSIIKVMNIEGCWPVERITWPGP